MTAAIISDSRPRLDLGTVIKGVAEEFARHWLWLLAVGLILSFIPQLVTELVLRQVTKVGPLPTSAIMRLGAENWIRILINIVPAAILLSLVVQRVVAESDGARLGPLAGLGRAPMAILTRIMMLVAIVIAYMLLIVPGILLSLAWAVAIPVVVAEGVGPLEGFSRSTDLTRNNRWQLLWLGLIYSLGSILVGLIIGFGLGLAIGVLQPVLPPVVIAWSSSAAIAAVSALAATLECVGIAVIYRELAAMKRGAGARSVAKVFE